jgi:hypothetical protein
MSFRSGIAQNALPNPASIQLYTQTTNATPSAQRNTIPIALDAGTYSCSISAQATITGTGSILLTNLNYGLSSSASSTVAIAPLPLAATASITLYGVGGQTVNAGSGFSDFKNCVISLSAPTTIYLYNSTSYVLNAQAPVVNITQNVTITQLAG